MLQKNESAFPAEVNQDIAAVTNHLAAAGIQTQQGGSDQSASYRWWLRSRMALVFFGACCGFAGEVLSCRKIPARL